MKKDYYVGLDIGTNSVGWAVTDENYKIPKFKGNAMWGIRLFDESNTAEERRKYRSSRRRNNRKKERLQLLEMLFNEEISKIDISFFQRLKESHLWEDDKTVGTKQLFFYDTNFKDYDFNNKKTGYPTIYHLRKELIENNGPHDIRFIFIALHHIIKNRGHFLFEDLTIDGITDFAPIFENLSLYLADNYEINFVCPDVKAFSDILKNKSFSKTTKLKNGAEIFNFSKKETPQEYAILSTLCGLTVSLCDIFSDDTLKDVEKRKISLDSDLTETEAEYQNILGERYELIEKLKAIYDWAVLADILNGEKYISYAKVNIFEQHEKDLKELKCYVKTYLPEKYKNIFSENDSKINNYVAYSKHLKINNKKGEIQKTNCSQKDFCEYLKKILGECCDEKFNIMFERINNATFMPKQVNKNNGVIPMQVHLSELKAILNNAENYLPFLKEKDEDGLTVSEKIISIFKYRIPYYVGPLNPCSKNAWLKRETGKIYPWNFEKQVDLDITAERFIKKLTSKCTYLPEKDVIPKNSLLYSKFMVLNELNNLRINGEKIEVSLKQAIFNDLFLNNVKVKQKKLIDYLKNTHNLEFESISGIDGDFKTSLKPWIDFSQFKTLTYEEKEGIIRCITIFGADKTLLKKKLKKSYSEILSEEELKMISKFKYSDWGKLSKEFLTEINGVNEETGEYINIINMLWETNKNLMEIISKEDFKNSIQEYNSLERNTSLKNAVESLYVSPKIKRPIYQSLLILKEIEKIQKCPPKKIFIEVARGPQNTGRTQSRKMFLLDLYKDCKNEYNDLYSSLLDEKDDDKFKSDKLYLYYTQLGRCIYTGQQIDFENLMGPNSLYDIDHIYPQSKIKDDSLHNRVLVLKSYNNNKSDTYPISAKTRNEMKTFWQELLNKKLITPEKYQRLVRSNPLTAEELSQFISRQLVETRQSTKAVAQILEDLYQDKAEIVYVKASLASDFRQKYELIKCREINDLHHAKDAYLNIVVGNVYNERVTKDKKNFIKGLQDNGKNSISLNKIFDFNIKNAWVADNGESISIVKNTMKKNNIRYTQYSYCQKGGLFDQNILKKGNGQVPIKANCKRENIDKYGGYNKASAGFFAFIEYIEKEKVIRAFFPINNYQSAIYNKNPEEYVKMQLIKSNVIAEKIKVIIPCIKYKSCLEINGFRVTISRKSGVQIGYNCAVQLVLNEEQEKYIKKIINYIDKNNHRSINNFDKLTEKENIELFDCLINKLNNTIYSVKFGAIGKKISAKREDFINLPIEKQCLVIKNLLNMLNCGPLTADLSALGEGKSVGEIKTNVKISETKDLKSLKLINQSITGLFEQEIELLNE